MIKLSGICKTYQLNNQTIEALKDVDLEVEEGEFVAVSGPSGCGKTTLLNILAGYDIPTRGAYYYNDRLINNLTDRELNQFFREETGAIFQELHLLTYLNVYENICLPSYYRHTNISREQIDELLKLVKLEGCGEMFPHQLSGGQKQRVAIARIMAQNTRLLLADEPTGALDEENSLLVMDIFKQLNERGMTIIMVTHDNNLALQADRVLLMESGHVVV